MALTQVSSGGIKDGSITNADLDASAAIDGSKVSPDFGSQNIATTGTVTGAALIPSGNTVPTDGIYLADTNKVAISSSGVGRVFIDASGNVEIAGTGKRIRGDFSNATHANRLSVQSSVTNGATSPWVIPNGTSTSAQVVVANASDPTNSAYLSIGCFGGAINEARLNSGTLGSGTVLPLTFHVGINGERLRITPAGLVGIGTNEPSFRLHTGIDHGTQSPSALWRGAAFQSSYTRNDNSDVVVRRIATGTTNYASFIQAEDDAANSTFLALNPSGGSVGVGTTNPRGKVEIASSNDNALLIANSSTAQFASARIHLKGPGAATDDVTALVHGNANTGGTNSYFAIEAKNANQDFIKTLALYDHNGDYWTFNSGSSGSESIRIESNGRFLIGTNSATTTVNSLTAKLQVQGTSSFDTGASIVLWEDSTNPAPLNLVKSRGASAGQYTPVGNEDTLGRIAFAGSDGTDFAPAALIEAHVDGSPSNDKIPGRLVFGTTASGETYPTERLRISNNGTFTGSASNDISDQRLKQNIQPIIDPLTKVKTLVGRTFEWKPEAKMPNGVKYGFIAQEVESVVPELVECQTGIRMLDKNGNVVENPNEADGPCEYAKSVQSSGVIPILVEALKEAIGKIETLEAKVAALEAP